MGARRGELTIDELAARVGMTVRNVRAYATRGLIAAPRLVGRKGYYNEDHVARLALVRDLIERGYTLNAVEKAMSENHQVPETHALDLLTLLTRPIGGAVEPEEMSVAELSTLAGVEHDPGFIGDLEERGLLERIDAASTAGSEATGERDPGAMRVRIHRPALVRAGAQAMRMGLSRERVLSLFDHAQRQLGAMAESYVAAFRDEVWREFLNDGMPEERWAELVASTEALLSIVSQAVLAAFRYELAQVIQTVIGEELGALTGEQVDQLFGGDSEPPGEPGQPKPDKPRRTGGADRR